MKLTGNTGMRATFVLLALLLAGVVMPAAAVDDRTSEKGSLDIVEFAALRDRPPSLIGELRAQGCSEEEIAEMIVNMPRVTYLDGWTEEDDKRVSPLLEEPRKAMHYTMHGNADTMVVKEDLGWNMSSSGMCLFDTVFSGVNGIVHPGKMECSSSGTKYQYLTTHFGKKIGSTENWIEIGVATFYWDPGHYHVFTYDNNDVGNEWITHSIFTKGDRHYNFEIWVSDEKQEDGYPYMLMWNGKTVRTGFVPFSEGDLNELHEYVRDNPGSFSKVSYSFVWDSYVYYHDRAVGWNEQLDAQLKTATELNDNTKAGVYGYFYQPWWSNAYTIDTWIR